VSALLALTDSAVQAVKDIVSSSEQVPETGGLRMVAERAGLEANFQLSVVSLPAEDDEVIEEQGARVFSRTGGGFPPRRHGSRRQRRAESGRVYDRGPGVAGEFSWRGEVTGTSWIDLSA
jgi:hypothetical protein